MSQQVLDPTDTVENITVSVYPSHEQAEAAIRRLADSGFNMKQLSIVGKDYHSEEHVIGYYTAGNRMMKWGSFGAFWGGIWGLLFGSAFFFIPVVGPVLIAGPLVAAIVAALEGAVIVGGMSALGAALVSLGVPEHQAIAYESQLAAGKFIVIAHGTLQELERARAILGSGTVQP